MIIKNANVKVCLFKEIPIGGVFKHTNCYYIKTWEMEDENCAVWNAVDLADGGYVNFSTDVEVIPYPKAYLAIE